MLYFAEVLALIFISIACYTDIKYLKIPNRLSLLPFVTGITLYTIKLDFTGLLKASIGGVLVFAVLFLLYLTKGLGAGDVKFITGLAFLLDFNHLWTVVIYSFLIAGIIALIIYAIKYAISLTQKWMATRKHHLSNSTRIPSIMSIKHIPFMTTVLPAFIIDCFIEVLL